MRKMKLKDIRIKNKFPWLIPGDFVNLNKNGRGLGLFEVKLIDWMKGYIILEKRNGESKLEYISDIHLSEHKLNYLKTYKYIK